MTKSHKVKKGKSTAKNSTRRYLGGNHLSKEAIEVVIVESLDGMNLKKEQEHEVTDLLRRKILPHLKFEKKYEDCDGRTLKRDDDDDEEEDDEADEGGKYGLRDQAILKARCWISFCLEKPKLDAALGKTKDENAEAKFLTRYFGKTGSERKMNNDAARAHKKKHGHKLNYDPTRSKSPDAPASPGQERSVRSPKGKSPAKKRGIFYRLFGPK